eukprot:6877992-Pyramimonas_sp.AAC.1
MSGMPSSIRIAVSSDSGSTCAFGCLLKVTRFSATDADREGKEEDRGGRREEGEEEEEEEEEEEARRRRRIMNEVG